jgi:hypothetical protein
MSAPGATIQAMSGGLEPVPALASPAALAAELLGGVELPEVGGLGERVAVREAQAGLGSCGRGAGQRRRGGGPGRPVLTRLGIGPARSW